MEIKGNKIVEVTPFRIKVNLPTGTVNKPVDTHVFDDNKSNNEDGLKIEKSKTESQDVKPSTQTKAQTSAATNPFTTKELTLDETSQRIEDIYKIYTKQRNLGEEDIQYKDVEELALLPNEQYQRITNRNLLFDKDRKVQFNNEEIKMLSLLSDDEFSNIHNSRLYNIPQRGEKQFSGQTLSELAQSPEKLARAEKLAFIPERKDKQFSEKAVMYIANLSDEHYKNFEKRGLRYIKERGENQLGGMAGKIAELSDEEFNNINKRGMIKDGNLEGGIILSFAKLSDEEYEFSKDLISKHGEYTHFSGEDAQNLYKISKTQPEKWEKIRNSGLLECIKEGKINNGSLHLLSENADLSKELVADLQTLKENKSIIPEFKAGTSENEAFKESKVGDAVQIGDKMFINDGEKLIPWQMTKEKCLELFPPAERFATEQSSLGDCYLVNSLDECIKNPASRAQLYQLFSQEGDDIKVALKGGNKTAIKFDNGNIDLGSDKLHLVGCKGLQMLEQAYAIDENTQSTNVSADDFLSQMPHDELMKSIEGGWATTVFSKLFNYNDYGEGDNCLTIIPKSSTRINMQNIPTYEPLTVSAKATQEGYMKEYANNPKYIVQLGTIPIEGEEPEKDLDKKYGIVSQHAYSVTGYDSKTKMVQLVNPANSAATISVPLSVLSQYIDNLEVTNIQ